MQNSRFQEKSARVDFVAGEPRITLKRDPHVERRAAISFSRLIRLEKYSVLQGRAKSKNSQLVAANVDLEQIKVRAGESVLSGFAGHTVTQHTKSRAEARADTITGTIGYLRRIRLAQSMCLSFIDIAHLLLG